MKTLLVSLFLFIANISTAQNDYNWGIGLRLGTPAALTAKKFFEGSAIEAGVGSSFVGRSGGLTVYAHWLIWQRQINSVENLEWYFGVGGQVTAAGGFYVGADIPIGVEYFFNGVPLSVFFDIFLYVELVDDPFYISGGGALGARYNF